MRRTGKHNEWTRVSEWVSQCARRCASVLCIEHGAFVASDCWNYNLVHVLHFVHLLFKFIESCNFPAKESLSLPSNNKNAYLHAKFGEFSIAICSCICMESLFRCMLFTSSLINVHFQASNIFFFGCGYVKVRTQSVLYYSHYDLILRTGHFLRIYICMASDWPIKKPSEFDDFEEVKSK